MDFQDDDEMVMEIDPIIRVYKDGRVERIFGSPLTPPSPQNQTTGVLSKDVKISEEVSARLYLLAAIRNSDSHEKIPILVYYHGGAFCTESAFSSFHDRYLNLLVTEAKVVVVSVEYRLAPEHPLPIAFDDCWTALQWVASHVDNNNSGSNRETWLINHVNFDKLYVGGDSAGANIAHNVAMRAGRECLHGDVKILGAILCHPYFLGSDCHDPSQWEFVFYCFYSKLWMLAYPSAPGGIDNPMINPLADDAPSLSGLGCSRLLVTVAEMDFLKQRAILYVKSVKKSEWKGEVNLIEIQGEDHTFHNHHPYSENAKIHMKSLVSFLAS